MLFRSIKYLGVSVSDDEDEMILFEGIKSIQTPLFDPQDLKNENKLNSLIRKNFNDEVFEVPESLKEFAFKSKLVDMLDFSRVSFDKAFRTSEVKRVEIESKWEMVKLESIVSCLESGKRPKGGVGNILEGALSLGGEHIHSSYGNLDLQTPKYVTNDFFEKQTKGIIKENDILLCKDGALTGKIAMVVDEITNKKAMINEIGRAHV